MLIPCINHNHVPLYLTSDIKICFCLGVQIGFLLASAPVIPQIERMMNKILLKALRCFIITCLPNANDVFRIPPSVGMLFFHSGQPIGSVDMCHQIKHVRFLDFLDFKVD